MTAQSGDPGPHEPPSTQKSISEGEGPQFTPPDIAQQ
jgi:hypothetical protein